MGIGTATITTTGDWQLVTVSYTAVSPGSTSDLNVYQTNQPIGTNLLVDDVSAVSSWPAPGRQPNADQARAGRIGGLAARLGAALVSRGDLWRSPSGRPVRPGL